MIYNRADLLELEKEYGYILKLSGTESSNIECAFQDYMNVFLDESSDFNLKHEFYNENPWSVFCSALRLEIWKNDIYFEAIKKALKASRMEYTYGKLMIKPIQIINE